MSLSTSEKLKVELRGHTAIVTIDNPGANTWDTESLPALKDLVAKLNENKEIYALVITGAGEKFFSAGADLKLFADGDPKTARAMAEYFGDAFETLADFRGVSIAAVNGFAVKKRCHTGTVITAIFEPAKSFNYTPCYILFTYNSNNSAH